MGTGSCFSAVPNKAKDTLVLESSAQHWCWELQLDSLEEQYMISSQIHLLLKSKSYKHSQIMYREYLSPN